MRLPWARHTRADGQLLAIGFLAALGAAATPAFAAQGKDPTRGEADGLLIVDCLLPGQIRKLGRQATYATPRRPVKTSAADCEIRGGEYVAYDRANYRTSLEIWLPAAEQGDPKAQNYVGEIYERGLGGTPDFEMAALWYRRAAKQEHAPAMINLGQLYEYGHGVSADPVAAVDWYRRASGLGTAAASFVSAEAPAPPSTDSGEAQELRRQLEEARRQRLRLEGELERLDQALDETRAETSRKLDATRTTLAAERTQLDDEAAALEASEQTLALEQRALDAARAELEALAAASGLDREVLESRREAQLHSQETLEARAAELDERSRSLASETSSLTEREARLATGERTLAAERLGIESERSVLERRERALADREAELENLAAKMARKTPALEQKEPARVPAVPVAGPEIELIDPDVPVTRGVKLVTAAARPGERLVIGRVTAPAGLLALTLNGREVEPDVRGLFRGKVSVPIGGLDVTLMAVDKQGKSTSRRVRLDDRATPTAQRVALPALDFGHYYALVIGNDRYRNLPPLRTATADARSVAAVLERRYGFEVSLLLDANRYQMLSALNQMRARLTDEDNLLIYYAGHGELDDTNARGHWLPVDAEPDSTANWISNVSVTDILNSMTARHIMVIADSCYSGTLTRSTLATLEGGATRETRDTWLRALLPKKSRTALTSGGLQPVLDGGSDGHSVFARTLLGVLETNLDVLEGQRLYREVSARVTFAAANLRFDQVPQYAPIKYTGHEAGDFFLIPETTPPPGS